MWKNMAEPDRPQMAIWGMSFACWIPKDTNIHSEYVIHTAFPLKQLSYLFSSTSNIQVCVPSMKTITKCPGTRNHIWSAWMTWLCFHPYPTTYLTNQCRLTCYLLFSIANQVRVPCFWCLLVFFLPSLLTISSCHSSYSNSDMHRGKRISWSFTFSRAVSSVFWRHYYMSWSGHQRDHCCLVGLKFNLLAILSGWWEGWAFT